MNQNERPCQKIIDPLVNSSSVTPCVSKALKLGGNTECSDNDFNIPMRNILPIDLLHVIDTVKPGGQSHIPMALVADGIRHNEIKVILKHSTSRIGPNQRDFEIGAAFFAEIFMNMDRKSRFLSLVEGSSFPEARMTGLSWNDNRVCEINSAESRVVVWRGTGLAGIVLTEKFCCAVDEKSLDEGSGGCMRS